MHKYLLIFLSLVVVINYNCDKVVRTEVIPYDRAFSYTFNTTGEEDKSVYLTKGEFMSRLDLPSDARIKQVEIQALSLNLKLNPGNNAAKGIFTGYVGYSTNPNDPQVKKLFDNKEFTFSSTTGIWYGWVPINTLVSEGITLLRNQINDWIKDYSSAENIAVMVVAKSDPAGQNIVLDVDLQIKATVRYEHCISTGKFMNPDAVDCEEAILN